MQINGDLTEIIHLCLLKTGSFVSRVLKSPSGLKTEEPIGLREAVIVMVMVYYSKKMQIKIPQ